MVTALMVKYLKVKLVHMQRPRTQNHIAECMLPVRGILRRNYLSTVAVTLIITPRREHGH
jgi:hypothetical protein